MVNELRAIFWPIVGSIIIAAGASTAGLYAFEERTAVVMLGFLVFIAGYRISQLGVHTDGISDSVMVKKDFFLDSEIISRLLLVIIGWIGISVGVTMFSQTILNPSLSNAVFSGVSSITGYMCAHVGINGVGLGGSFFRPNPHVFSTLHGEVIIGATWRRWAGLIAGLAVTSMALSTGFIWACGSRCITEPAIWASERQVLLVFTAALVAWWGYLFAHYAWTGSLIDQSAHDEEFRYETKTTPSPRLQQFGVIVGVSTLVCGMVIGVIYIRNGNHLMTNIGGILFLGGFVIAHFMETGKPL